MKGKIVILLAFVFIFIIHGVASGDGGGLPPLPPQPPGDVTGAYVKGYFTVAYDKANPNQYTHHNVHAVLAWDRTGTKKGMVKGIETGKVGSIDLNKLTKRVIPVDKVHLFSATRVKPLSQNLCRYTADELKAKYSDLPNQLGVPAAFGLPQATAYITQLKIINRDLCGDLNIQEPNAMIQGEVEILLYTKPTQK